MWLSSLTFYAFIPAIFSTSLDFCSRNLWSLSEIPNTLQFTKELSPREYAVDSEFKSLHCCAKGYFSIEWLKDGLPYPWPSGVSSFILYPEAANQTIYTKFLSTSDAGNYTCRLHNDTTYSVHTTELKVFDSAGYMEHPLATYRPQNTSFAREGESTRLFCEAFVGHIDLPDAQPEVVWSKEESSRLPHHASVEHTSRDKGQIVGAYLTFRNIEESDFGTYVCSISNTGDQQIVMTSELRAFKHSLDEICLYDKAIMLGILVAGIVLICLLVYTRNCGVLSNPSTQLFIRKFAELSRASSKKRPGVIVLYGDGNETFMEQTFLPSLQSRTNFCYFPIKVSPEWGTTEQNKIIIRRAEKIIIMLSKHIVSSWTQEGINESLANMMINEAQYCVVLLQPLPNILDESIQFFHHQRRFSLLPWDKETFNGEDMFRMFENPVEHSNLRLNPYRLLLRRLFPASQSTAEVNV